MPLKIISPRRCGPLTSQPPFGGAAGFTGLMVMGNETESSSMILFSENVVASVFFC